MKNGMEEGRKKGLEEGRREGIEQGAKALQDRTDKQKTSYGYKKDIDKETGYELRF